MRIKKYIFLFIFAALLILNGCGGGSGSTSSSTSIEDMINEAWTAYQDQDGSTEATTEAISLFEAANDEDSENNHFEDELGLGLSYLIEGNETDADTQFMYLYDNINNIYSGLDTMTENDFKLTLYTAMMMYKLKYTTAPSGTSEVEWCGTNLVPYIESNYPGYIFGYNTASTSQDIHLTELMIKIVLANYYITVDDSENYDTTKIYINDAINAGLETGASNSYSAMVNDFVTEADNYLTNLGN